MAFTVDMIRPYKLKWLVVPFAFLLIYLISIFLDLPIKKEVSLGIHEWVTSELMNKTSIIPVVMAYIPVGFLGFYSIKMPRKEEKIKGLWLLAGFFMMATFSNFLDPYGIVPPILPIRRILIAIGILILYKAFVSYRWIK